MAMARETVITLQIIGALMALSAVLMFLVPAENIWPWVFLFASVGLGLSIGPGLAPHKPKQSTGHVKSDAS
jgi:hypothetical protein